MGVGDVGKSITVNSLPAWNENSGLSLSNASPCAKDDSLELPSRSSLPTQNKFVPIMKHILITGGAGFTGSHLCERLWRREITWLLSMINRPVPWKMVKVSGHPQLSGFLDPSAMRIWWPNLSTAST